jgi:hypothetical protein
MRRQQGAFSLFQERIKAPSGQRVAKGYWHPLFRQLAWLEEQKEKTKEKWEGIEEDFMNQLVRK